MVTQAKKSFSALAVIDVGQILEMQDKAESKKREIALLRAKELQGIDASISDYLDGMEKAYLEHGLSKAYARNNKGNFRVIIESYGLTVHIVEVGKDGKAVMGADNKPVKIEVNGKEALEKQTNFQVMVKQARDLRKDADFENGKTRPGQVGGGVKKMTDTKMDSICKDISTRATVGQIFTMFDLLCRVVIDRMPYCKAEVAKLRAIGGEVGDAYAAHSKAEGAKVTQLSQLQEKGITEPAKEQTDVPQPATGVIDVSPQEPAAQQQAA